jgi:hypothetical protein
MRLIGVGVGGGGGFGSNGVAWPCGCGAVRAFQKA